MEEFHLGMAELLEVDSVNDSEVLEDFEAWDSLTSLSIIAFVEENYKVPLTRKDLIGAKTIGGLKELILARSKNNES